MLIEILFSAEDREPVDRSSTVLVEALFSAEDREPIDLPCTVVRKKVAVDCSVDRPQEATTTEDSSRSPDRLTVSRGKQRARLLRRYLAVDIQSTGARILGFPNMILSYL